MTPVAYDADTQTGAGVEGVGLIGLLTCLDASNCGAAIHRTFGVTGISRKYDLWCESQ